MRVYAARYIALLALSTPFLAEAATVPERVLGVALRGPVVPYKGQQKSTVYFDVGPVSGEVTIFGDGKGRTRREYRKGAAAGVVMLQSGPVTWQRQGGVWVRLPGSASGKPDASAARIVANYKVTVAPAARMLGREVVPLRADARKTYNPSRRLWVDVATGIVLRDDLFAPGGRMRSSTAFTSLALGPQPKALFAAPPAVAVAKSDAFGPSSFQRMASSAEVQRISGRPVLFPSHVPQGYAVELYGVMTTRNGRYMPAVRYSDGLAAFTIFQRGPGAGPGGGRGRGHGNGFQGAQSDRQRAVVIAAGRRSNYLLVGDIAESELKRVADSLP
jgi:hypothetical protein